MVAQVRRALRVREVGHAGTLDPFATGVLVMAVGEATKLVAYLSADDKAYEATVLLGVGTDTLDAQGAVVVRSELPVDALLPSRVERVLEGERERTTQVPPQYSAVHHQGERAYDRARRGEVVELAARSVAVRELRLVGLAPPLVELFLVVAKGYYVRALARDLAEGLGTVGHLVKLRRVRSGHFSLSDAVGPNDWTTGVIPLADGAKRCLPYGILTDDAVRKARFGQLLLPEEVPSEAAGAQAWLDTKGQVVAVGERRPDGFGRVLRGFGIPSSR